MRDAIQAAHNHAAKAAGLLCLMEVTERANLARLREAKRLLDEAARQAQEAINAVERRINESAKHD